MSVKIGSSPGCLLVIVYRPPPSKKNKYKETDFLDEFDSFLGGLATMPGKVLMMGDFNVHWNAGSKSTVKCFQRSLAAVDFKQYIESATHKSGNTIDLVISRPSDQLVSKVYPEDWVISDHVAIRCDITLSLDKTKTSRVFVRRYK